MAHGAVVYQNFSTKTIVLAAYLMICNSFLVDFVMNWLCLSRRFQKKLNSVSIICVNILYVLQRSKSLFQGG